MLFYQDLAESYKRLQGVLEGLLHEKSPELTVSQDDDYPLLVLETSSDLVGFAVINGIPDVSYPLAYDTFDLKSVKCTCGKVFCFKCKSDDHSPCTCE